MSHNIHRRDALKVIGATAIGAGVACADAMGQAREVNDPSSKGGPKAGKRSMRIAHLTDIHVQPERNASQGMIECLHHVQSLPDKPELILTGGDSIMDSFESDDSRTKLQWDIWRSALKNECSIAVRSCIGNHDIWGWNKERSRTTGDEPSYGKRRAVEMLQLNERYYSFDSHGWKFIVLDSTQSDGAAGYRAYLDETQLDWLVRELSSMDQSMPTVVLSHIPILAASAILWARQDARGDFTVSGSLIHQDAIKIKDLFAQHRNVKLCLAGHLHHGDRVDYNGVTYLCNGAVSGNWWKGRHKDTDEGYAVIDLYDDGTFKHEYIKYGWKAQP